MLEPERSGLEEKHREKDREKDREREKLDRSLPPCLDCEEADPKAKYQTFLELISIMSKHIWYLCKDGNQR